MSARATSPRASEKIRGVATASAHSNMEKPPYVGGRTATQTRLAHSNRPLKNLESRKAADASHRQSPAKVTVMAPWPTPMRPMAAEIRRGKMLKPD